jgi:hypothetical protein
MPSLFIWEVVMKFYSGIPDLHIVRQRTIGNRTEGYLLCKFDENGELESNDPEIIRQLRNIYRHDESEADTSKEIKTESKNKVCKYCGNHHEKPVDYALCAKKHKKE